MNIGPIAQATAALVESSDAGWLFDALMAVVRLQVNYPVCLTGEAAVVDPLRELARDKPGALDRVLNLVDSKRAALGLPPLVPPVSDKFDKREYMRQFMDQKRQRQRRAVEIENLCRSERDMLRGRSRLDFMDTQAARWKSELDERLQRAREARGGPLDQETLDTLRKQFWQWVDESLDEAEAEARRKLKRG